MDIQLYCISMTQWLARQSSTAQFRVCLPGMQNIYQLVHSDILSYFGRDRRPNLLFMQFGVLALLRLKPWSARGASYQPVFGGNWPTIIRIFLALSTYPLDELSFKEMKTLGQSKISSCCLCVQYKSREFGGKRSPRFSTQMVEIYSTYLTSCKKSLGRVAFGISYIASAKSRPVGSISPACFHGQPPDYQSHVFGLSTQQMNQSWVFYKKLLDRVAYGILSNINNGATLQMIGLMVVMLMVFFSCGELVLV